MFADLSVEQEKDEFGAIMEKESLFSRSISDEECVPLYSIGIDELGKVGGRSNHKNGAKKESVVRACERNPF